MDGIAHRTFDSNGLLQPATPEEIEREAAYQASKTSRMNAATAECQAALAASARDCAEAAGITEAQAEHIIRLANEFGGIMTRKYVKGVKQHGGNLWERSPEYLLNEAIAEATDQVVYLLTLREKLYGKV